MTELAIDIETYSSYDLPDCGVYRYVEAPDFAILLFAYAVDGGAVQVVDIARGETLPTDVLQALTDESVIKTAYNAAFERICIGKWLGVQERLDPRQWRCTMVAAARLGFPMGLGICAQVLGVIKKMPEGAELIRYFSKPDRGGKRRMPDAAPERWQVFKAYCKRDVETEQAILAKVRSFDVPDSEWDLYALDQAINDRGVALDMDLVDAAMALNDEYITALTARAKELTGLENPNSTAQLRAWLAHEAGMPVSSIAKGAMDDLAKALRFKPRGLEVLDIRRKMGKSSVAKYAAMKACVCDDGRAHGLMQYYGSRTGRWAGRLIQVQNLPQNHLPDLDLARRHVLARDMDSLELGHDSVTGVLSELIRTAFVASPGMVFHVCDFSAIEARVIAWLADEEWAVEAFRQGKDIYCETASQMFGKPVEKHGRNADLRQKGKIATLALGYGGGVKALEAMGARKLGMLDEEIRDTMLRWRKANRNIVKLWGRLEAAARRTIEEGKDTYVQHGVACAMWRKCLTISLPSGRKLCYPRATIGRGEDGEECIRYEGMAQTTRKWESHKTYGGKLTENVVQAIARDILADVMLRADRAGMAIVFHVHDEIIVEADPAKVSLADVEALFGKPPRWCSTLPVRGAGYTTPYYIKD